jgi:N-acetylmuramoyl-L-alanine amidase
MRLLLFYVFLCLSVSPLWSTHDDLAEHEAWQNLADSESVLSDERLRELFEVYAPSEAASTWFRIEEGRPQVRLSTEAMNSLPKAGEGVSLLPAISSDKTQPLSGWRIAIDPGHLGGEWGPMEHRSFRIGEGATVQEGDLVLAAAKRMKAKLERLGATVLLIRSSAGPVTSSRPEDFLKQEPKGDLAGARIQAERAFLRSDIRARAERLQDWGAHLVIDLHINAAPWPDPEHLSPSEKNHGHILINGAYLPGELASREQRLELVRRWLLGYHSIEREIGTKIAESMAEATGLEAFRYTGPNAVRVNENPYLWARNLMATRIYPAPVVYLEPWVLNHREVYAWACLGDYDGTQEIDGEPRRSLPEVYAEFVARGVENFALSRAVTP